MNNTSAAKPKGGYLKIIIPFALLFAVCIAAGAYFYLDYREQSDLLAKIDIEKYEASIESDDVWENAIELKGKSILELNEEQDDQMFYIAPNGLKIQNLSGDWNGKVKSVYEELLNNIHGNEIDYLKLIILKSGASADGESLGDYHEESSVLTAAVSFNSIISDDYINFATVDYGYINIYYMNDYTEIKEFSRTLSHEYGHHFAFQHLFTGENEDREASDYYEIRGLDEYPDAQEYATYSEYLEMHAWDIDEIAAEDYVQLLGSSTGREIGEYMDIYEALYSADMEYTYDLQPYHYNVFAQENPVIPLAEQVEGLEYYFNSFVEENYTEEYEDYPAITLEAEKMRSNGKTRYVLTWNDIELAVKSEVVYTVVCYNADGSFYRSIKTISGEEELSAVIGTPVRRKGSWLYWWDDGTMEEDRIIRVLAYIVNDDIIVGSLPYYFDF